MTNSHIAIAHTPEEIRRCHPVMRELRTHITDEQEFVDRVQRQQRQGYQLAFLEANGEICAVAGYRFLESLFSGRIFTSTIWSRASAIVREGLARP